MELPIDHFRLLGVSPTSDTQAVLHALKQRLDRPPDQGFTAETLESRAELLRASADLLADPERRGAYGASLLALSARAEEGLPAQPALEVPSSREVGGMLLLLEAGQPLDCFELAQRSLQPPQAPALGSGRESDLILLAGLSCTAAATELHQQRRYEGSARTLRQGLQLLQRTGQQPGLRQQLQHELEDLQPFRVLDLLSRDLGATAERAEGLALLDELVQRRGGLEGKADPRFPSEAFQAFFKQIRSFLTVQEQVDLFSRWAAGSRTADFLATTALTASGFAQRKPDRIAAALERLRMSSQQGTQPLQACLHLLLGQVEQAVALFSVGAPPELRYWARQQSSDPLAQLCVYCRDWLARDVLPGYRDLEADPDLEAFFADRDVQAYLEKLVPQAPAAAPAPATREEQREERRSAAANPFAAWGGFDWNLRGRSEAGSDASYDDFDDEDGDEVGLGDWLRDWRDQLRLPTWRPQWPAQWPIPGRIPAEWTPANWPLPAELPWRRLGLGGLVAAVVVGGTLSLNRCRQAPPTPIAVEGGTAPATPVRPPVLPAPQPSAPPRAASAAGPAPLTAAEPSEAQLESLLQAWLAAKSAVLAGRNSPLPLENLARPIEVQILRDERAQDAAQNRSRRITTTIRSMRVNERSPARIAATVRLDYSSQRLNADGSPRGQASTVQLRNRYVFARDDGRWLVASFERAD